MLYIAHTTSDVMAGDGTGQGELPHLKFCAVARFSNFRPKCKI